MEKPRSASSAGVRRRAKIETALVLYNDLDATLTGRIMCTLTPTPNSEYDIPVSNYFSHLQDAKDACFKQDEKKRSNYGLVLFLLLIV